MYKRQANFRSIYKFLRTEVYKNEYIFWWIVFLAISAITLILYRKKKFLRLEIVKTWQYLSCPFPVATYFYKSANFPEWYFSVETAFFLSPRMLNRKVAVTIIFLIRLKVAYLRELHLLSRIRDTKHFVKKENSCECDKSIFRLQLQLNTNTLVEKSLFFFSVSGFLVPVRISIYLKYISKHII